MPGDNKQKWKRRRLLSFLWGPLPKNGHPDLVGDFGVLWWFFFLELVNLFCCLYCMSEGRSAQSDREEMKMGVEMCWLSRCDSI